MYSAPKSELSRTIRCCRPGPPDAQRELATLAQEDGFRDRNPHQLRHTVATALISAADPIGDGAKYLGDAVEVVVMTDLHPTGKDPSLTLNRL